MSLRLAGKHCAIVGATGTIGTQIAKTFAAQGAVLSLMGRSVLKAQPNLEPELTPYAAPETPETDIPSSHRFIPLDASKHNEYQEVFFKNMGPVDILINCAGITQTNFLKRTPDHELSNILNTNLLATMLACKYAKMRPHGCIINVSSLMATKGSRGASAYAASKAGVVGFTRALCLEMSSRSIRVNALLPGWVDSPMWNQLKPALKEEYLKDTPLRRVATPAEVADAAIFLATNSFANNCVLNLDGGLSAV